MLLKLLLYLGAMPQNSTYYAQMMLTLCSLYLSSYCNLITNITCLWVSAVFMISLQRVIFYPKEITQGVCKGFLETF